SSLDQLHAQIMWETIRPGHHDLEGFSNNSSSEEGATTFVVFQGASSRSEHVSRFCFPGSPGRFGIGNRGGNGQLGLCAGIELTREGQLTPYQPGAFLHAGQAVV